MDNPVILSACRTPIGPFGGAFKDLSAVDLGAAVIRPVEAMRKAVDRVGIGLGDLDAIELNEVFAAQSVAVVPTHYRDGAAAAARPRSASEAAWERPW